MVFLEHSLVRDTRVNSPHAVKQKGMEGLIQNTLGSVGPMVYGGILTDTKIGTKMSKAHIPVIHTKTHAKRMGQVPYAGPNY